MVDDWNFLKNLDGLMFLAMVIAKIQTFVLGIVVDKRKVFYVFFKFARKFAWLNP